MKDNSTLLGFNSTGDLLTTTFGTGSLKYNCIAAIVAGLTGFINNYIYNDAKSIYLMMALLALDFITGVLKSFKQGNFRSGRMPRVLLLTVIYCLLLSLSWQASKINDMFTFLPGLFWGGLV